MKPIKRITNRDKAESKAAPSHIISYSRPGQGEVNTGAYGKIYLLNMLRDMMRDGYTDFRIKTVRNGTN